MDQASKSRSALSDFIAYFGLRDKRSGSVKFDALIAFNVSGYETIAKSNVMIHTQNGMDTGRINLMDLDSMDLPNGFQADFQIYQF